MLNAICDFDIESSSNLLKSNIVSTWNRIDLFLLVHLTYKFCFKTRSHRLPWDGNDKKTIIYYLRKCTQNEFVYMKFSFNWKICFRPNENCRLQENLLKLDRFVCVCVCTLKLMLTKFSLCIKLAQSFLECSCRLYVNHFFPPILSKVKSRRLLLYYVSPF